MRLKKLIIKNYCPFKHYEIEFPDEDNIFVLLTGKNNEGKSSIINALKLLDSSTKVISKTKQTIYIKEDTYYRLLVQDTEQLNIPRLIHNYENLNATIHGIFSDNFEIFVYLDPLYDMVYSDYLGTIPEDVHNIFGFIPPLGQIAEYENCIQDLSHLRASLYTTLGPRHLRNHFRHFLSRKQFEIVKQIINSTWENIEIGDYEVDYKANRIDCFYKEKGITREICWAGQGLQIWFQIITHLVRLKDTSILILDEPEIFLHAEKQNDLIRILNEYYDGGIIIATHSMEMINNVNIGHIINVKKTDRKPRLKTTSDRRHLEIVRSQIGSRFNFIASQYDDVDILLFTEDVDDYRIVSKIAELLNIDRKAFNIPIHGFCQYKTAIPYIEAYKILIGKEVDYSMLLDRDYYPLQYLDDIKTEMKKVGVNTCFSIGKEIENMFLNPIVLCKLFPDDFREDLEFYLENLFQSQYDECFASFISLHKAYLPKSIDVKTIIEDYSSQFNDLWNNPKEKYRLVGGKSSLNEIKAVYRNNLSSNLTHDILIDSLLRNNSVEIERFIQRIFQI